MIVNFFEPPTAQKTGGLELAIRALERFLRDAGVSVRVNPPLAELGNSASGEIAHFHGLWQPRFIAAYKRCRKLGLPYVVSPHGMLEPWAWRHKWWKKRPYFWMFERRQLRGASRLLATSEMEKANLARLLPASRCVTLPLGLGEERSPDYAAARNSLGWKNDETVLLFLARLHPKKGLHLLLRALANLALPRERNLRLVIVGGGSASYENEVKALARRLIGQLPPVTWAGEIWSEKKWPYFQGADLYCLPTFSENFGLSVLEALQVGTPVLTTDQTPWTDLPRRNAGYIASPDVQSIEQQLRRFLAAAPWTLAERASLAEGTRRRFSWETVGPKYLELYRDLCGAALSSSVSALQPQP